METSEPPLAILAALANPARCQIVRLLCDQPHTVSELCDLTGMKQPAVSKHLKVLDEAGIAKWDTTLYDGRMRVYEIRRKPFAELEAWLTQIRAAWNHGVPFTPLHRDTDKDDEDGEHNDGRRNSAYTTRGTPRIRKRYYWRKADQEAAERGDEEWLAKEEERLMRQRRAAMARAPKGRRYWGDDPRYRDLLS
jgi:DNA-binding transcriptional ArsR family regulator